MPSKIDDFETILYVLLSSNSKDNYLLNHLNPLEASIERIEYFQDPDQCMLSILATEHGNIFLVLDEDRSNLVEHFATFSQICYIYLRQAQKLPHMPKLRGVYPDIEQLVDQLKMDIRIVQHSPLHLNVSQSGDSKLHRTLAKHFQPDDPGFYWSQILLEFILAVQSHLKIFIKTC